MPEPPEWGYIWLHRYFDTCVDVPDSTCTLVPLYLRTSNRVSSVLRVSLSVEASFLTQI